MRTKTSERPASSSLRCSTSRSSLASGEATATKWWSIFAAACARLGVGVGAGVLGVGGGDAAGGARQGGREEERLAVGRGAVDDPVDGGAEAHVEHPVGLVEDEDPDPAEGDRAAVDQVLEPAGGGDEDVGAPGGLDLGTEADAAVDGGDAKAASVDERLELVDDLAGELPGRGEDEGLRPALARLDQVDERDAEGERLARAGRRLDEEVVARERIADDHLLDGERLLDRTRR